MTTPSPAQSPLRFVAYSPSASGLTRKRQRLNVLPSSPTPATPSRGVPALPHSPYRFNSSNEVVENPAPIPLRLSPAGDNPRRSDEPPAIPYTPDSSLQHSLAALEANSHLIRQGITAHEQSDKETGGTYKRHFTNYCLWWDASQATLKDENPAHVIIPALPIIPSKVTMFLQYETTRPQKRKRADDSASTGTVGIRAIQQVISALEKYRSDNAYKYPGVPETQFGLRTDIRIKAFESAGQHNEPQRVKMAHSLKAKGTNADTFTSADLMRCAAWCLTDFRGPSNIYIGLRDRAMLLTSCSVAFRGDSTRSLLLSDLFMQDVVMNAKGLGEILPALTLIADNAKHNQSGRTDEHGAFRHRYVELCPVGSIALLLFSYFHVRNCSVPDFAPDFSDLEYGDFGKREWYGMHLFPSGKDPMSEMGYDNHRKRVNLIYEKNGVNISKITHAGREFSVKTAREYGATVDGAKALGGWSTSGSFKPCYDRALPVDALLGAAMFDAARPESHFLPREFLEPPADLVAQIFPWVEAQQADLEVRERENPFARDIALHQLFKLLIWFRTLLLQDGALLYTKYPTAQLFQYPPFNTVEFRAFAANSVSCIADVEARGRLAVKNLPQNLVRGFQGAISSLTMSQRAARDETQAYMLSLDAKIMALAAQWRDGGGPRRTAATTRSQRDSEPVFVPPPLLNTSSSPVPTPTPSTSAATFDVEISTPDDAGPSFPSAPLNTQAQQQFSLIPPTMAGASGFSVSQTAAWNLLALTYTDGRLRRHQWDWIEKSNSFLPHYTFQPVPRITDIWTEWATGLNGYLSVRELNEGWNAKWKHDLQRIKSEYSRRKKVIDLIERLRSKPNWNLELALRFIRETYEMPGSQFKTTRSFCDYLQSSKTGGVDAVIQRSNTFIH